MLLALGRAQWRAGSDAARATFLRGRQRAPPSAATPTSSRAPRSATARAITRPSYPGPRGRELLEQALAAIGDGDSPRRVLLLSRLAGNVAFAGRVAASARAR